VLDTSANCQYYNNPPSSNPKFTRW